MPADTQPNDHEPPPAQRQEPDQAALPESEQPQVDASQERGGGDD